MKLNRKGYTLVELLAVVVILSVLLAIMIPSVNYLIDINKENNYKNLKESILGAAKMYMSDNRYNIILDYQDEGGLCVDSEVDEGVLKINEIDINGKITLETLVSNNYITTNKDGYIINPMDNTALDLTANYVEVKYQCSTKDYTYTLIMN